MKLRATDASGGRGGGVPASGAAQNWRQRLGEVIRFCREARDRSLNTTARRCRVSVAMLEAWERGESVPNREQWKQLCRDCDRELRKYAQLYQAARSEMDALNKEQEMNNGNRSGTSPPSTVATNLGDKLRGAQVQPQIIPRVTTDQVAVVSESNKSESHQLGPISEQAQLGQPDRGHAVDGRRLPPTRPPGSTTHNAIEERKLFVRGLLLQRPKMRTSGGDSILEAVRARFGIGIKPDFIDEIRRDLQRDAIERELRAKLEREPGRVPADHPALQAFNRTPAEINAPPVATVAVNTSDVDAAVQLILGAVPNLQTLTISVDDHGEASVDYQIREVKITTVGGSLKVRR